MTLEEQLQYIKDHYLEMGEKPLARAIGRSNCFVRSRMKKMGLVVPKEIIEQRKKDSYYKKGNTPYNKGKKMEEYCSAETMAKIKKSQFKKGHLPHNTKHDLAISKRMDQNGYYYYHIRVSLGKWVVLHRYLWEKAHGKIPRGHNVQFKDGNQLNCTLENLYLIRKKDQLVININGGANVPHELQETILLINKLKLEINAKEQSNRSK